MHANTQHYPVENEMLTFLKAGKYCERIKDTKDYKLDPRNGKMSQNMEFPATTDELSQFVLCCS